MFLNLPLILAPIAGAVASSLVRPGSWEERIQLWSCLT